MAYWTTNIAHITARKRNARFPRKYATQPPGPVSMGIASAILPPPLLPLRERVDDWMGDTNDRRHEGGWPPSDIQEERVWKSPWIPRHDGRHC
jgi:hypothetical protein